MGKDFCNLQNSSVNIYRLTDTQMKVFAENRNNFLEHQQIGIIGNGNTKYCVNESFLHTLVYLYIQLPVILFETYS
jgi:hypothetical protein